MKEVLLPILIKMRLLCTKPFMSDMTKLILELSSKFKVPALFLSGTTKEKEDALTLGAKVLQLVQIETAAQEIKTAVERKEAEFSVELSAIRSAYTESQDRLAIIQKELEELHQKSRIQIQESKAQELEQRVKTQEELQKTKQDLDIFQQKSRLELKEAEKEARRKEREATMLELEGQIQKAQTIAETAEERRRFLENTRDADIQAAEQRVKAMMSEIIRVREEQVKSTEGTLQNLQHAYVRQTEQLQALNDFLRRKITNGKAKGNDYELQFREILTRTFHITEGYALEDTNRNGIGHAGDFLMVVEGHRIMWEVKNYDKPVPKQESEKFQRDMLEHKDIQVGVMISRCTEITGKASQGDRHIEFLEGKLLIYLSRFEFMGDEQTTLQSLMPLFRVWWSVQRDETETEHVEETIRELEKVVADLAKRKTDWRVHRSRMEETMRWMTEVIQESEDRVEAILRRIQSGQVSEPMDVPEGMFRSEATDEKVRKTIGWILEEYDLCASSEIRLKDVAEKIAVKRKISQDVARKYILAALMDSAILNQPGKAILIKGLKRKNEI